MMMLDALVDLQHADENFSRIIVELTDADDYLHERIDLARDFTRINNGHIDDLEDADSALSLRIGVLQDCLEDYRKFKDVWWLNYCS